MESLEKIKLLEKRIKYLEKLCAVHEGTIKQCRLTLEWVREDLTELTNKTSYASAGSVLKTGFPGIDKPIVAEHVLVGER